VNVLDAPGYADFVGETKSALRAADSAVIVLSAADGVEVGSEQVWGYTDEAHLPRLIFVNKMERENANFLQTLTQAREAFGNAIIALELPIGAAASYSGNVDLLSRIAYGLDGQTTSIPGDLTDTVEEMRQALVEKIAETDDDLIERFLSDEEITDDELKTA